MGKEKNDCITLTKKHLSSITFYDEYLSNQDRKIADMCRELDTIVSAPISKYDMDGGSGASGSTVEVDAEKRIRLTQQINSYRHDANEVRDLVSRLRRAIALLDEKERGVVSALYLDGYDVVSAADKLHLSTRTCYRTRDKAVHKIAVSLYGVQATKYIHFIFTA